MVNCFERQASARFLWDKHFNDTTVYAILNDTLWVQQLWFEEENGLKWRIVVLEQVNCPAGYALDADSIRGACKECQPPMTSAAGSTACDRCRDTFYMLHDQTCAPCPKHATCTGGSVLIHSGYYQSITQTPSTELNVYECPFGKLACLGGNTTHSCALGYGGVLCAVCQVCGRTKLN